jgi:methylenetetrahydrofolate reductase (NADPH)
VTADSVGLDLKITELFERHDFTMSAEIMPPRNGSGASGVLQQIQQLTEAGAQYLAVTKGAGGSLRGGSLPIAQTIKTQFRTPCIAHFTCRDLLPEEVENQLVDHHLFGIRNILALRGDPPQGTEWKTRKGSYEFAYQLVEQIRELNDGKYLERSGYMIDSREKTQFCIGVACYPDHPVASERVQFFRKKVEAGAEFAISQMLFDPDSYARFLDETAACSIPVLPGTRLLKSKEQAQRMSKRFQVPVAKSHLALLPDHDSDATAEQTLKAFYSLTEKLRAAGAPGIHLFVLGDGELSIEALRWLKPFFRI